MKNSQGIEPLERRCMLSASITFENGLLRVSGGDPGERIVVSLKNTSGGMRAAITMGKKTLVKRAFSQIVIDGGGGNDSITLVAARIPFGFPIEIFGGNGNDAISANSTERVVIQSGAGNDTIDAHGGGRHDVRGGFGDDTILIRNDSYTSDDPNHPESYANGEEGNDILKSRGLAPHTLDGGPGRNKMYGSAGTTYFYAGSDWAGSDRVIGGAGDDIVRVSGHGTINVSGGTGGDNQVTITQDLLSSRNPDRLIMSDNVRLVMW